MLSSLVVVALLRVPMPATVFDSGRYAERDADRTVQIEVAREEFVPGAEHGPLFVAALEKIRAEEDRKEPPITVDVADLIKDADKYHGKVVRIEATLKNFLAADDWTHAVNGSGGYVEVSGKSKPDVCDGDTVAFTGTFKHAKGTFVPSAMSGCTVEKVTPKKP